jgi:branched-chain amino acid transport system ATP-binding protein
MKKTSEKIITLKNIHVQYGGVKALDGIDFELDEGEVVVCMGPNGAGKSTVLKALFGLAPLADGTVSWHDTKIIPVPHEMVERGVSFVPQGRQLFKSLTVRENLEMGGYTVVSKKVVKERIEEVLDLFPMLRTKQYEYARNLSGGQQQMVAIARGLMTDPKVLLLDEPSLGLAPKIVKEVFEKIKEINEKRNTAVVVVEHNLHSVLGIADTTYLLDKGKVVAKDKPDTIVTSGILEKVFLGNV